MTVETNFCEDIYTWNSLRRYLPGVESDVGIGGLILGVVYFCSACATLYSIRKNRQNALLGVEGAAMRVIFPIYLPLLFFSALSDFFVGLIILFVPINFREPNSWNAALPLATAFAFQHFVIEGTAFTLMQYGCGYQAFRNFLFWGLGWGVTTFLVSLAYYRKGINEELAFALTFGWNWVLFIFYFILWTIPETKLYRRDAARYFARFWTFIRLTVIVSDAMFYFGRGVEDTSSICIYSLLTLPVFVVFKPFIVYRSLLMESVWWQGLPSTRRTNQRSTTKPSHQGQDFGDSITKAFFRVITGREDPANFYSAPDDEDDSEASDVMSSLLSNPVGGGRSVASGRLPSRPSHASGVSTNTRGSARSAGGAGGRLGGGNSTGASRIMEGKKYVSIQKPLDGVEVGFHEAQELAQEVDNIHQEGTIRLLNSAYLSLDKPQKLLGAGSFSKVYAGYLKGYPVALKMLFTQDINPDVIRRCSNEAKILSEISNSPNVVKIYGVSIFPPSVCLVLELCTYGSLSDVLRGSEIAGAKKPPLKLSLAERMWLALGCALGLEALHNYSPDLCHRDIKSMNFLIDGQLNAKIADLDLGQQIIYKRSNSISSRESTHSGDHLKDHASGMNITWQAPEVLLGQGYSQKSDIHSLALVLWEIIASGRTMKKFSSNSYGGSGGDGQIDISTTSIPISSIPYSDCKNQADVREKIVRGYRPSVTPFIEVHPVGYNTINTHKALRLDNNERNGGGVDSNRRDGNGSPKVYVDPMYIDIMTRGWSSDPNARPDIHIICRVLRQCYMNTLHRFIGETPFIINYDQLHDESLKKAFTQQFLSTSSSGGMMPGSGGAVNTKPGANNHLLHSELNISPRFNSSYLTNSFGKITPSKELIESVNAMKLDKNWSKLEGDGSYLVLSPYQPFYMVWATKKWTQSMGYFIHDLLGVEISLLYGPKTDVMGILRSFERVMYGQPQHLMCPLYRRDGRELLFSLNFYPVFDSSGLERKPSTFSLGSSGEGSRSNSFRLKPGGRLSFSSLSSNGGVGPMPPTVPLAATGQSIVAINSPLNQSRTPSPSQPSVATASSAPAGVNAADRSTPSKKNPTDDGESSSNASQPAQQKIELDANILQLPPVGFMDLLYRSSSEYTAIKDILLPHSNSPLNASGHHRDPHHLQGGGSHHPHSSTGRSLASSQSNNANPSSNNPAAGRQESTASASENFSFVTRPSNLSLVLDHAPLESLLAADADLESQQQQNAPEKEEKSMTCFPFYEKYKNAQESESLLLGGAVDPSSPQHPLHPQHAVHPQPPKPIAFIVIRFNNLKDPSN